MEPVKLKLHLGCGQTYLDGYVNIDWPSSEHTVQTKSVADRLEDITELRYGRNTVHEIRLHHVFEHFRRPQVAAMAACWNTWLVSGGTLHIEVPDLGRIARVFANPFSSLKTRAVAERHLFGSHEAAWAAHFEGYDEHILRKLLGTFGFEVTKVVRKTWRGTHNIHVFSRKSEDLPTREEAYLAGETYLKRFLVDRTPGELEMLQVWMSAFESQLLAGWPQE